MDVSPIEGGSIKIDQNTPEAYPFTTIVSNKVLHTIEAVPASNYKFVGWSGDLISQENPVTLETSCAKRITANFMREGYNLLTIVVEGAGSVSPSAGTHDYARGTTVKITATPDSGYQFDGWTGDVSDPSSASTSVNVDSDKTVTATFSIKEGYNILNIEVKGAGSVTPPAGTYSYAKGTVVNITAKPGLGYVFNGWTGEVDDPSSANTTVIMDSDKTVIASFSSTRVTYILTMRVNGSGSVSPAVASHRRTEGTIVDITATPDNGYKFDGWTGDVADPTSASTTVMLDKDKTVTANFSKREGFDLIIKLNGPGSVSPSVGIHGYGLGVTVNISASPDKGYKFDGWTGDVADPKSANTTVLLDTDKTVTASFSKAKLAGWVLGVAIAGGLLVTGTVIWLLSKRRRART